MPFISEVSSIFLQRFYTGWVTLRNQLTTPIRLMGRRVIELYDALIAGNDWEVTPFLSLKRRAGHTAYVTVTSSALAMYSWKSNTQGTIPMLDLLDSFQYVDAAGAAQLITFKRGSTGQNLQSSILGIGNFLYVGNPQTNFKWDGPAGAQGKTNWGIAIGSVSNATGPNNAGAGANAATGIGTWVNPNNVTSSVSFCTIAFNFNFSVLRQYVSKADNATTFGFSIPATTIITGIVVTLNGFGSVTGGGGNPSLACTLLKGGVPVGNTKFNTVTGSNAAYTFGSVSDLWGNSLTPNDVNQTNFGVAIQAAVTGKVVTSNFSMNNVAITVYGLGGPTATPTGSGSFSAVNGFTYVFAYGNAISGEVSNASPFSANTGPFTNKAYVGVGVTASTDPQVNQIRVYRTTDSGGGNQFFELPNSPFPNTTATIQDTALDTALQVTSQAEINLGNTPPPVGLINLEWFAGRMWGSLANILFASTGPQTLSGTAPNSNWHPDFQYVLPQPILRNVRGPNGMLVFTVDDCYIVRGTDITNYTVNEFVKDFGIRTQNAIDTDGTNLYVYTSDKQFIQVTASGASDIGQPIADQIASIDPTQCYVKANRYGLDSIVRILDTVNNLYIDFNVNQQCWNLPGLLQMPSCTAMGSIETAPGVWRLLVSSTVLGGFTTLAYRDIANFQDLGTSYVAKAVFGSIQLADPGNLAKFGARGGMTLEYTTAGLAPVLSVLPNDAGCTMTNAIGSQITGNFVSLSVGGNPRPDPPTLGAQPQNYRSLRYYWSVGKNLSAFVRHLQFQIVAVAENKPTELIGWGIFGDEKSETETSGQLPQLQGR